MSSQGRRSRGERAGINLAAVITAARALGPDNLTMQAVADRLGIDRKTVNHYVRDRASLIRLAAASEISDSASEVLILASASWQDATRIYAVALVESLLSAGQFAADLRLDSDIAAHMIEPTERIVEKLSDSSFTLEDSVRFLAQLSTLCTGYARDVNFARSGDQMRADLLRAGLSQNHRDQYPLLAEIAASGVDTYGRAQLDLILDTFIAGTDALRQRGTQG